jgi:hypothetical protein
MRDDRTLRHVRPSLAITALMEAVMTTPKIRFEPRRIKLRRHEPMEE